jgi:hypothetical protein
VLAALLIILLILATPIVLITDGPIVDGLVAATMAGAVAVVARTIRPGAADYVLTLIRPIAPVAVVPALWMLIQILPLGVIGLSNPVWDSAALALGHPVGGGISIDPGATLIALGNYLSTVAIIITSIAVASDRRRAEWMLFALMGATALVAAVLIGQHVAGFNVMAEVGRSGGEASNCIALGLLLSITAAIRTWERYETRRLAGTTPFAFVPTLAACLAAFAACSLAIALRITSNLIFAVASGLATLLAVVLIRRLGPGRWGTSAIAVSAIVAAIALIAIQAHARTGDWTLAFAGYEPSSLLSITQRILADSVWTGSGAGTFAELEPIYRGAQEVVTDLAPPTTAAAIAVELGRPMLWASIVAPIIGTIALLGGALRRGRDSFYPALGASCLVTLLILAFGNVGLFSMTVSIIAAAILGLAFAQSKSRTIQ